MQHLRQKFPRSLFAACFAVLMVLAPWLQAWLSQSDLLSPPYEYMLDTDLYSLSCRIPGVLMCLTLALAFYSVNVRLCKTISTRVNSTFIELFFNGCLLLLFALILPVVQIFVQPFIGALYDYLDVKSVCSRQSSFYWKLWVYVSLSYLFSAVFLRMISPQRGQADL